MIEQISTSSALIGPLGLNPLLALGGFGLAAWLDLWTPPGNLTLIGHPGAWVTLLTLGLLIKFGRSSKLTKPVAEVLGTGESLVGVIAAVLAVAPELGRLESAAAALLGVDPAGSAAQAGMLGSALALSVALLTVGAVMVVRTALDILTWLSPIPFVDMFFQAVKLAVTFALIVLAVVAPPVAVVVNLALAAVCLLLARWALRAVHFGLVISWDASVGRLLARSSPPLPTSSAAGVVGPLPAYATAPTAAGWPARKRVELTWSAGTWTATPLGPLNRPRPAAQRQSASQAIIDPGLTGITVVIDTDRFLLPARYLRSCDALIESTRSARSADAAGAESGLQPVTG